MVTEEEQQRSFPAHFPSLSHALFVEPLTVGEDLGPQARAWQSNLAPVQSDLSFANKSPLEAVLEGNQPPHCPPIQGVPIVGSK